MKTTILNWENATENIVLSDWMQENEIEDVLHLFEADPDIMNINGYKLLFIDLELNKEERIVIYLDAEYKATNEEIENRLLLFYQDNFQEYFEKPEYNTWETFYQQKDIIAYRGGKGYQYTLWNYLKPPTNEAKNN